MTASATPSFHQAEFCSYIWFVSRSVFHDHGGVYVMDDFGELCKIDMAQASVFLINF